MTTTKEQIRAGQTLAARYKQQQHTCEVVEHDGRLYFVLPKGRVFMSPSAAGRAVTGTARLPVGCHYSVRGGRTE